MGREFNVVVEKDEEGWLVATVPSLPGCHTQARTEEELLDRIREAIGLFLKEMDSDDPGDALEPIGLRRVAV